MKDNNGKVIPTKAEIEEFRRKKAEKMARIKCPRCSNQMQQKDQRFYSIFHCNNPTCQTLSIVLVNKVNLKDLITA